MTQRIPLSNGKEALVDDDDYPWLIQWKWSYNGRYAARHAIVDGKSTSVYMHREILKPDPGMYTDHINGDRLDNRRCNLRSCSHAQNSRNMRKQAHPTSSAYKGVSFHKASGRWAAGIRVEGKRRSLGYYETEIDAAYAYDEAARQAYGEYAALNLPDSTTSILRERDIQKQRMEELKRRLLTNESARQIASDFNVPLAYVQQKRSHLRQKARQSAEHAE